jgi:ABC-type uncharacterized transport system permease subunit
MDFEFGFYLLATLFLFFWVQNPRKRIYKKLGFSFLGLGFTLFLFEFALAIFGRYPLSVFQILASTLVGIFYFIVIRFKKWNIDKFAPVVATFATLFSLLGLKLGTFEQKNLLVPLHVFTSVFAFSLLVLSAIFSLFRYAAEKRLKEKRLSLPLGVPISAWIKLERNLFFFGFILFTLDLILSFLVEREIFGNLKWDSRIFSTLLLWVYYWILFHLDRFGVSVVRERFHLFNLLGAIWLVGSLILTKHNF